MHPLSVATTFVAKFSSEKFAGPKASSKRTIYNI